jgi:hypothetical protein
MHRLERLGVQLIEAVFALALNRHQADLPQHAEVLGHSWLWQSQAIDNVPHGLRLSARQELDDLAAPGFGDGVKGVGGGGCTWHDGIICL